MAAWLHPLLYANVMASALIALVCMLRRFGRRALGSRFLYACWLLVALRLLLPVMIPVRMPDVIAQPLRVLSAQAPEAQAIPAAYAPDVVGTAAPTASAATIEWGALWLAGVVAAAAWMALRNIRYRKALHLRSLTGAESAALTACAARHGLRLPRACVSAHVQTPCLVGGLRAKLVLPQGMPLGDEAAGLALRHEACHAQAGDAWWALLRTALCCLHWFNPMVWLAARLSASDAELACDAQVMAGLDGKGRMLYARILVDAAQRQTLSLHGLSFAGGRLRARVTQILEGIKMKKTWMMLMAALMVVAFGASLAISETAQHDESGVYITAEIREGATFYRQRQRGDGSRAYYPVKTSTMDIAPQAVLLVTRIQPATRTQPSVCHVVLDGEEGRMYLRDLVIDPQTLAGKQGVVFSIDGQSPTTVYEEANEDSRAAMVLHGDFAKVEIDQYGDDWCRVKLGRNAGYVPTACVGIYFEDTPDDISWFWEPAGYGT